jgi:hypothetical protein
MRIRKQKRTIIPCLELGEPSKTSGAVRVWGFCLEDISRAVGKSVMAVRKDVSRGKLDPRDLASLVRYVTERIAPNG